VLIGLFVDLFKENGTCLTGKYFVNSWKILLDFFGIYKTMRVGKIQSFDLIQTFEKVFAY